MPLSYKLHGELAAEHNGAERWGYRRIHCGQLSAKGRPPSSSPSDKDNSDLKNSSISLQKRDKVALGKLQAAGLPKDLNWFSPAAVRSYYEMGDPSTTAQVHPYLFTASMATLASEGGAEIITNARVTSISTPNNTAESVTYTTTTTTNGTSASHTLPASDIILAAGPWTSRLFPSAPISALRAHSVTIRPSAPISAYALFTEIALPSSFGHTDTFLKSKINGAKTVTPEIYARPNNEAYCCGEGDTLVPLPPTTADVETDDARCQDIIDYVGSISDEMRDGEVLVRQACYLPTVQAASGGPLVGETGVKGVLMAAGHSCWGIQNGPATGKLISEFVFDGRAVSAKIGGLDPRKVL